MTTDEHVPMRRTPRQERGRQRVAAILEAAEAVFGAVGYEAATTNQIAAHAGVPIGSLYQYFPNKEALLHAVAAQYRLAASAALDAALTDELRSLPVEALGARLLETMVAFGTARIGLTKIVLQAGANDTLAAAAAGLMSDATERLAAALAARAPTRDPARHRLAARVALTAVMALLGLITAEKAHGSAHAEALLTETRTLLVAYLAAHERGRDDGPATDGTIGAVS